MKILLILSLILTTPVLAQTKEIDKNKVNRVIYCFDLDAIWKAAREIEQDIVWVGKDDHNTQYALLVSKKDKNFSLIHFTETRGCILGGGTDFRYGNAFEQPKKDSKK